MTAGLVVRAIEPATGVAESETPSAGQSKPARACLNRYTSRGALSRAAVLLIFCTITATLFVPLVARDVSG